MPHFPRHLQGRAKAAKSTLQAEWLRELSKLALPDLAALLGRLLPADFSAKAPDAQARGERLHPSVTVF